MAVYLDRITSLFPPPLFSHFSKKLNNNVSRSRRRNTRDYLKAMPEDNNKTAASLTSFKLNESTFIASLMPKKEIVAGRFFFESNPQFDGRGVIIAVFDSGVDPAADGLKLTSDGKPKILDVLDWYDSPDLHKGNGCLCRLHVLPHQ